MSLLLHPAVDSTVAQCIVRSEQTGEFFMSQAHPESDGSESVRISRMSSTGAFLDQMMCTGGGHGTSIALSTINGKVQIWMPWAAGGFGSPRQHDLVRFEYQAGTFHRDDLSSLVVQIPGPKLRYVTFDYTGGYAMVRTPTSTTETYERYDLTLWQANDVRPPQFTHDISIGTTTTQGFCTYEDAFYRYSGGANAPSGDTQKLVEYSWETGAPVRTVSTVGLAKDSSGNWIGGRAEPEGSTLYAGGGRPRLYLGVTTGPAGGPHVYYLWSLSLMTKAEMVAAATTTPTGTTTGFTYGQTEPTYGNTGVGTVTAAPTVAYTGSMAPTTSVTISNRIINGVIRPGGQGVTITLVNCIVQLVPDDLRADTRTLTATGTGKIVAQFCDITATGASLWVNGAGTKNITLDRCYVYNVVDGVDSLGGINLRGCLIEKLLRLADPADASGVTHNDGVQIVGGAGHTIYGCAIHAFNSSWSTVPSKNNVSTTAIMLTPNLGAITGLSITYNWIYGGDYPINGLHLDRATGNSGEIAFNRFGSLVGQDGHTIDLAAGQDNITTHDNVYLGGGAVTVYRGGVGKKDVVSQTAPVTVPPTTTSGTGITLGVTKPTASNTGAGVLRPVTASHSGDWTVSTASLVVKDTYVHGKLTINAPSVIFENCIIEGPANDPGSSGTVNLVNANGASVPAILRYCTIKGKWKRPNINGVGNRNVTLEYCKIENIVDGLSPSPSSSTNDVRMKAHGCYIHDHIFYAGSETGHNATPLTSAGGQTIVGPSFALNVGWTHCDAVQVEADSITGLEVVGCTIEAFWSTDPNISMLPLPHDSSGRVVIKELSCFMLNGGRGLVIDRNWLDGGEYAINNADGNVTGTIQRNRFGRGMAHSGSADSSYFAMMLASGGLASHDSDASLHNVWENTGATVYRRGN